MPSGTLSIGQIAARTGLAVSAIRYYEELGLVQPERNAGGQRRYLRSDIRRLSFVMIAQQFGFSLPQIAQGLAGLPAGRTPTKADWARIARDFLSPGPPTLQRGRSSWGQPRRVSVPWRPRWRPAPKSIRFESGMNVADRE